MRIVDIERVCDVSTEALGAEVATLTYM
jgi:hypothetical protein